MKRTILIFVFIFLGISLFAEVPAIVREVKGKVEIKAPGKSWIPAKPGMKLAKKYKISTGFRSQAVLRLGESILVVKQLTRMELSELIKKKGVIKTSLYLRVGKIKATVKRAKGIRQDFKVKSPISTAAVRGTSFEFDGRNLRVFEGTVGFINNLGQRRFIGSGEISKLLGGKLPNSPQELKEQLSSVVPESSTVQELLESVDTVELYNTLSELLQSGDIQDILEDVDVTVNVVWD